jgi:hypothetical protein
VENAEHDSNAKPDEKWQREQEFVDSVMKMPFGELQEGEYLTETNGEWAVTNRGRILKINPQALPKPFVSPKHVDAPNLPEISCKPTPAAPVDKTTLYLTSLGALMTTFGTLTTALLGWRRDKREVQKDQRETLREPKETQGADLRNEKLRQELSGEPSRPARRKVKRPS